MYFGQYAYDGTLDYSHRAINVSRVHSKNVAALTPHFGTGQFHAILYSAAVKSEVIHGTEFRNRCNRGKGT